jgi:hypothetical protein
MASLIGCSAVEVVLHGCGSKYLQINDRISSQTVLDEYLTTAEVAARLKLTPKTIKNKMAAGIFRKGVHYFRPEGLSPRFKWSAVVAWIEQTDAIAGKDQQSIPMARGYQLGEG